jgi:hypothetical protein
MAAKDDVKCTQKYNEAFEQASITWNFLVRHRSNIIT